MSDKEPANLLEFSVFMKELEKEYHLQTKEEAHYRAHIAEISIKSAQKVGDVIPFYDRKQAKEVVLDTFPDLQEDRAEDAGNMLHLVVTDLTGRDKSSSTAHVSEDNGDKMQNRNRLE